MDANEYRYNQVREWQSALKTIIDKYTIKVKKYKRRVVVLDVMVYSVSAVVASTGVVLSALTPVTAVAVITICVASSTTIAGVFSIIAKKISTCANTKLYDYAEKLNTATAAYSKLSSLISLSLDAESNSGTTISDSEFELMASTYNDFVNLKTREINNNGRATSTNSRKYGPGKNHNDNSVRN